MDVISCFFLYHPDEMPNERDFLGEEGRFFGVMFGFLISGNCVDES